MTLRLFAYTLFVFVMDQFSKTWLTSFMLGRDCQMTAENLPVACRPLELLPNFNLVMVWNYGASFGLFASDSAVTRFGLAGLGTAVSIGLFIWLIRTDSVWLRWSLPLVIGGAMGNVVDRLIHGAVADFFDFHVSGWHWPAFNVADIAICIGVAGLICDSLFNARDRSKRAS